MYHTGIITYLSEIASLMTLPISPSYKYGSLRSVSLQACARKKGETLPAWYHRARSSGLGL